jgi:hypothetical protein
MIHHGPHEEGGDHDAEEGEDHSTPPSGLGHPVRSHDAQRAMNVGFSLWAVPRARALA